MTEIRLPGVAKDIEQKIPLNSLTDQAETVETKKKNFNWGENLFDNIR